MNTPELARRAPILAGRNLDCAPDSAELTLGYEAAYPFLSSAPPDDATDELGAPVPPTF